MTWVIIASGQSLTSEQIEYVAEAYADGRIEGVGAVSNVGLDHTPWASFIASHDASWWKIHRNALSLNMRRFCRMHMPGTEQFIPSVTGCNSGLMAMEIACKVFGAKRLVLLGFDMHGTHYFGKHEKLKNTSDERFKAHLRQFDHWQGPEVVNCTPGSALKNFPFKPLSDVV